MKKRVAKSDSGTEHLTKRQTEKLNKIVKEGDSIKFIKAVQSELSKNGFYDKFIK